MDTKDKLIQIGLTEKQAKIYFCLLENGISPAKYLIFKTGLKRGITYEIIDQLIKLNLIEKIEEKGKITLFRTTHPNNLETLFEKQKKETEEKGKILKEEMGNFISMYNLLSGKPNVQFFEGDKGIMEVLNDSLNAKETILEYVDNEIAKDYIPKENEEYVKERIKKGIKKKMLSPESDYIKERVSRMNPLFSELKIMKNVKPFNTALQIYDNKISYITLKNNKKIGIIIEDEDIAKMHKIIFNQNWENGEKLL